MVTVGGSRIRGARVGSVVAGATLAGALSVGGPAFADVTVDPTSAPRGAGARVTFQVPEQRPGAHTTKVQIDLPAESPIAEAVPMSVEDWAPRISNRTLDEPIVGLHGTQVAEVTERITWIRVRPPGAQPGAAVEFPISIGGLPDADQLTFALVQTYSDGTVVHWGGSPGDASSGPAPVLTLTDADSATDGHDPHASPSAVGAPASGVTNGGGVLGLVVAGAAAGALLGGLVVWWIRRPGTRAARRLSDAAGTADAGSPPSGGHAPTTTGGSPTESRWRLRQD